MEKALVLHSRESPAGLWLPASQRCPPPAPFSRPAPSLSLKPALAAPSLGPRWTRPSGSAEPAGGSGSGALGRRRLILFWWHLWARAGRLGFIFLRTLAQSLEAVFRPGSGPVRCAVISNIRKRWADPLSAGLARAPAGRGQDRPEALPGASNPGSPCAARGCPQA